MIVAAAIKVEIKKTKNEVVLCGVRHGDVFKQLKAMGLKPTDYKTVAQGFVNNNGEFLTRGEAYIDAVNCGQIPATISYAKECNKCSILFSEDLY